MIAYVMATGVIATPADALPSAYAGGSTVVLAMCILAYPLVDTLRVFTLRAARGQSPFNPDRNHIHHRLMMLGWSHAKVSTTLYLYTGLFLVLPVVLLQLFPQLPAQWTFFVLLPAAFLAFQPALGQTRRKALRERALRERGSQPATSHATSYEPQSLSPATTEELNSARVSPISRTLHRDSEFEPVG
jgi:hypothetical protein